ncbi:MAG: ABC transporter ATP-binding protein [Bacteroidota bacterium]|nr:ABC transporter ATP-binding protein [Bacteroidota bacterium]
MIQDTELPNIIELRQIDQSYDHGKNFIIKDLNFLVEDKPAQGQFVVILGMSGSGKSTILRYIAGLQTPTKGTVLIHDRIRQESDRVGMVFQQYSSFPWLTVLENVSLGLKYQGVDEKEGFRRAIEMIELVGLTGHEKKFAQYPTLSGGQLQRVAIGRSLMTNPDILLMDEPFGALDVKTRLQMQELLANIWHRFHPTIIFVTHDISEAVFLGDEIYIMKSPPSKMVDHIIVDLPLMRNRETKQSSKYLNLVQEVEKRMLKATEY